MCIAPIGAVLESTRPDANSLAVAIVMTDVGKNGIPMLIFL